MKKFLIFLLAFTLCLGSFTSSTAEESKSTLASVKKGNVELTSNEEIKLYDVVTFGNYPQNSYGDSSEIEWIVIGINGTKVKLLSRYALDSRKYHDTNSTVTWQGSSLYNWLNSSFKNTAFTSEEQMELVTPVSLLSVSEAQDLPSQIRICQSTAYAISQGADPNRCIWWLSSFSGEYEIYSNFYWWDYGWSFDTRAANCSSAVLETGEIAYAGYQVNYSGKTIRPTIVVDLQGEQTEQTNGDQQNPVGQSFVKKNGAFVTAASELRINDVVKFGNYPQNSYGDISEIEWVVIGIEGDKVKLLSKYALDSHKYHDSNSNVTWQGSSLYNWLNDTFKSKAFSLEEQKLLATPISLPSIKEAQDLPKSLRACQSTQYAIGQGADRNRCLWWLSSFSGEYQIQNNNWWWSDTRAANCASVVNETGEILQAGYQVNYSGKAVRPLIVIEL